MGKMLRIFFAHDYENGQEPSDGVYAIKLPDVVESCSKQAYYMANQMSK